MLYVPKSNLITFRFNNNKFCIKLQEYKDRGESTAEPKPVSKVEQMYTRWE